MKIMIFRKIKTSCNTKTLWKQFRTFWFFTRFDSITHLQYHIKKTWKYLQNIIFSVNAFENHFPDIWKNRHAVHSQVWFECCEIRCVDCALCFVWWKDVVIQSGESPGPCLVVLAIPVLQERFEAGPKFAKGRHPQKSPKRSVWRVVRTLIRCVFVVSVV